MNEEKIGVDDLEEGDIVFLDKIYGYCSIVEISLGINQGTIVVFEATGIGFKGEENPVNKVVSKYYKRYSRKQFQLYE